MEREANFTFRPFTALLAIILATSTTLVAAFAGPTLEPADALGPVGFHDFKSIGQLTHEARLAERMHDHARDHGANHPTAYATPQGDPVARAKDALHVDLYAGRTAMQWVEAASAERLLALEPAAAADADLVADVARLYGLVGVPLPASDLAGIEAQAAALPVELRAPFAALVHEVVLGYEAQLPIAQDVLARWPAPFDDAGMLSVEQREAMVATAERIVAAQNAFRAQTGGLALDALLPSPLFSDPEGLVVLGGLGNDVYARGGLVADPVLSVDLAGDDMYFTSAGGACPDALSLAHKCNLLVVSVAIDLAGHDVYAYDGVPAAVQGAGSIGGLGILIDASGSDLYSSKMTRNGQGPLYNYIDGGAQGFAQAGYGLLLDASGDDVYRADVRSADGRSIWDFAQGYGAAGGVGLLADAAGRDAYYATGLGIPCYRYCGFQGVYNNGVGFYGGVGVQSETSGDDLYQAYNEGATVDYYAQGFGGFAGLGILYEQAGDDRYSAVQKATDPWIVPLLNCAFGTGSLGGVGIMLELAGNDIYYGDSISPRAAETMNEGFGGIVGAYGLLVDVSGDDGHFMEVHGGPGSKTAGRGVLLQGGENKNLVGTYLDLGGVDAYTGAAPSRDNAIWTGGADLNFVPAGLLGGP